MKYAETPIVRINKKFYYLEEIQEANNEEDKEIIRKKYATRIIIEQDTKNR
jgi:hypothetical protein